MLNNKLIKSYQPVAVLYKETQSNHHTDNISNKDCIAALCACVIALTSQEEFILTAKAREYVFTGVGLCVYVCVSVCLSVTTITK